MGASLSLHLRGASTVSGNAAPDLPVTLQHVAASDGSYAQDGVSRSLMVRAGVGTELEDLAPGIYRIEASIPGGRPFRRTVDLADGVSAEVTIEVKDAGEAWLGLQTFAGNVPGARAYSRRNRQHMAEVRSRASILGERGIGRRGEASDFRRGSTAVTRYQLPASTPPLFDDGRSGATAAGPGNAIVPIPFEIGISEWLDDGDEPSRDATSKISIPSWWADDDPGIDVKLLEIDSDLDSVRVLKDLGIQPAHQGDALVDLWRFQSSYRSFDAPLDDRSARPVAVVDHGSERYMACLPMPWVDASHAPSAIEVLFDRGSATGHPLKVLVADPEHTALLAFLASRDMAAATNAFEAGRFSHQIKFDMYAKRRNPLAAAAAAYTGLAFAPGDPRRDDWSHWLVNLKDFFPNFPDGAILYGRDRLERATSREDLTDALSAFMEGYRRGIPYFSLGIRQLRDGLRVFVATAERYGMERETIAGMHETVSRLASRADPGQCFTVLRFRGAADV